MKTRKSIRLPSYDYTSNGAYFITVCTSNREHSLGEIIDHEMKLSRIGEIVSEKWFDILDHNKHVDLGEFIVMPNHIHGIIWIVARPGVPEKENSINVGERPGVPEKENSINVKKRPGVPDYLEREKRVCQGKPQQIEIHKRKFGKPQSGSLSIIVNQFKGSVKCWCNKNNFKWFNWQRNYYEHIIRNNKELLQISEYIKFNPQNWSEDEYR